ncbi:MAG: hypothetical protein EOM67_17230, partial [Spirochaetia bacterium]|nr:hypothetical protein [Spirochaetia bacterium]
PLIPFVEWQMYSLNWLPRGSSERRGLLVRAFYILRSIIMTKDEYQKYLQTDHWQKTKRAMLDLKPYRKCELCGSREHEFHVHHMTYENIGHEGYMDLVVLCSECHKKVHKENLKLMRAEEKPRNLYFNTLFSLLISGYSFQEASSQAHDIVDNSDTPWEIEYCSDIMKQVLEEQAKYPDYILIRD